MQNSASYSDLISIFSLLLNSDYLRWLTVRFFHLWHSSRFQGIYKVYEHDVTLELLDREGATAVYIKHQKVEFLQNGIFAIQDQAWGDGNLFARYTCSPGVAVDRHKEGHRWKILISLQSTRNKGDKERFVIERMMGKC